MNILNERDRRLTDVTDYIYDKTGEILGTYNDSMVDQVVSGFVVGFAGSFYETFDLITHPEIILANVFEAVTYPIETAIGIIENKVTKGMGGVFRYLEEKNYRMVGQEAGRMAGEKVQDLIAAAVVATVLQTCGDGEDGGGMPPKSGRPDTELPEVERKRPLLELDLQFFGGKDGELSIEGDGKIYSYKEGIYEKADYHGTTNSGRKNKAPINGQAALDNLVSIKDTTTRRIGISDGEIVVFDETTKGVFHGHVRSWNELTDVMKNALRKADMVNKKGKIIV